MAKFDYKKWVTENKYGKINEQAGSATINIRNCNGSSTSTLCLPNASNYSIGHQFKYQTAQGVRTGFLQSIVQQGCSAGQGAFYTNIDTIEDPYVGACANNNTIPNVPSDGSGGITGSGAVTGGVTSSVFTGSATTGSAADSSQINPTCYGCEKIPNVNNLTVTDDGGYTSVPNYIATGELITMPYNSLDYQYSNFATDSSGYCGSTTEPYQNFYTETGINSITSICQMSASMVNYGPGESPLTGSGAITGSGEEQGSFGTGGNYTVFDYPPAFDVIQWTANFIAMIMDHPNPCNFLTQRITLFNNQLQSGVGPLQANQLMQKMAVCQELFQMTGCGGMNEQISGIKRYRLDPKAADVLKKAAPRLRGLAQRGKGRKRVREENKQLGTLKRIIKETLSELKEKQKGS